MNVLTRRRRCRLRTVHTAVRDVLTLYKYAAFVLETRAALVFIIFMTCIIVLPLQSRLHIVAYLRRTRGEGDTIAAGGANDVFSCVCHVCAGVNRSHSEAKYRV